MSAAIEIKKLSKTYPNGTKAVNDVSFSVGKEDLLVVIGRSGAGKSTLLRCMNRLLEPTDGKIIFEGNDISHVTGKKLRHVREKVGMIFQQFNLVSRLTVLENVLAGRLAHCSNAVMRGLSIFRIFPKSERDFAFDCLKTVGIENLAYQRADQLSGGQQQRVAIARALAQEPIIMLADEPVASLDPASSEVVMETLQDIQEKHNIPVLVNLHQIDLAKSYGKKIIGMSEGKIIFDSKGEDLTNIKIEEIYGIEVDPETGRPKTQRRRDAEAKITEKAKVLN